MKYHPNYTIRHSAYKNKSTDLKLVAKSSLHLRQNNAVCGDDDVISWHFPGCFLPGWDSVVNKNAKVARFHLVLYLIFLLTQQRCRADDQSRLCLNKFTDTFYVPRILLFGFRQSLLQLVDFEDKAHHCKSFTQSHIIGQNATSWTLNLSPEKPRQCLLLVGEQCDWRPRYSMQCILI